MSPAYIKLVLQDYEKKRAENLLSLLLMDPTPARLKDECINVCSKRYSRKDGRLLNAFFGEGDDKSLVSKAIAKKKVDEFRPVLNYLNKDTTRPDGKYVELVAWLIDFERRPYQLGEDYDIELEEDKPIKNSEELESMIGGADEFLQELRLKEEVEIAAEIQEMDPDNPLQSTNIGSDETTLTNPLPASDNLDTSAQLSKYEELKPSSPFVKFRLKYLIFSALLVFVVFTGFLVYRNFDRTSNQQLNTAPPTGSGCMEWIDDHYEQVPCSSKPNGRHVIAVDPQKLKYFRKINKPDTLTMDDIGKVWYIKLNGKMEFYTAEGFHPLDMNRRLRPISAYIIDKYILSEKKQ